MHLSDVDQQPNCGYIKVIIYTSSIHTNHLPYIADDDVDTQHISTKVSIEDEFPFKKHKDIEENSPDSDDDEVNSEDGSDDDLDGVKKKKIKKKSYKKKVKRPRKSESYAFVEMTGNSQHYS